MLSFLVYSNNKLKVNSIVIIAYEYFYINKNIDKRKDPMWGSSADG